MPLNVVILAAGQGKRMHSDLPKVLHRLAGRPMLGHVIATARALQPGRIVVVYGHGGAQVKEAMQEPGLAFALQEPQLGTGHALQQALPHLDVAGPTLVLYGDVPLITAETLRALLDAAGPGVALLAAELERPTGYGRVLRLATTLLDPVHYPALDVIETYHSRWEFEVTLDEIKTEQSLAEAPLRGLTPARVTQELYGLVLAH